jgi:hypothetical protein
LVFISASSRQSEQILMFNDHAVTLFLTYAFRLVLAASQLLAWPSDQRRHD